MEDIECFNLKLILHTEMRRVFTFVALLSVLFIACETDNGGDNMPAGKPEDAKEYALTLTSQTVMEFSAEGGKGEIGYALTEVTRAHEGSDVDVPEDETITGDSAADERPEKQPSVEVTCTAEWITDIVVGAKVSFNVLPNEGDKRETFIVLAYEKQEVKVLVRQLSSSPADVEFKATHLSGTYFGKLQTYGYNYFIVLSDVGLTNYQDPAYGATQYIFDLYSDVSSAFEPVDYLPEGVYEFGDCTPGTIDAARSYYIAADGSDMDFGYATVTVTKDKIVAEVRMMSGKVHRVTYEGSLALDYTQPTIADVPASTLTADVEFDVTGGTIMAYYRGDYYGKDADVWFLHMIEDKATFSGTYLMMDILVDKSKGGYENKDGFVGEYTVLNHTMENFAGTFAPGCVRDDTWQLHTWYMNCINSAIDPSNGAPFVDGKITIAKEGDDYTLTMDGKDDIGNKIKGTFRGRVGDYQNQAYDL